MFYIGLIIISDNMHVLLLSTNMFHPFQLFSSAYYLQVYINGSVKATRPTCAYSILLYRGCCGGLCVCVCVCVCVRVCHKQMVVLLKNMFNNGACKTPKV